MPMTRVTAVEWRCHYAVDFLRGDVRYLVDQGGSVSEQ
jgi:hypothetical protein